MNVNIIKKMINTDSGKKMIFDFIAGQCDKEVNSFIIQKPDGLILEKIKNDGASEFYRASPELFFRSLLGSLIYDQVREKVDFSKLPKSQICNALPNNILGVRLFRENLTAVVILDNNEKIEYAKSEVENLFFDFLGEVF